MQVVLEDGHHRARIAAAQVAEVHFGDHPGGDVGGAAVAEHGPFEGAQRARLELLPPEPAGRVQQVQVDLGRDGRALAVSDVAGQQQRHVERLAVKGDDGLVAAEHLAQRGQHRRLLGVIAHEILPHQQPIAAEVGQPDHEDVGAGPAGQPGRLGVQEDDRLAVDRQRLDGAGQAAEATVRHVEEAPERLLAVPVIERQLALGDETGPERPLDHRAGTSCWTSRSRAAGHGPVEPAPRGPRSGRQAHPGSPHGSGRGRAEAARAGRRSSRALASARSCQISHRSPSRPSERRLCVSMRDAWASHGPSSRAMMPSHRRCPVASTPPVPAVCHRAPALPATG